MIFILDEMSGLNSFESKTSEGIEFDKIVKDFSKKYEFNIYSNSKTSMLIDDFFQLNTKYKILRIQKLRILLT